MLKRILLNAGLLCSITVWASDKIQSPDVKIGLWETTTNFVTRGEMPLSNAALSRLTPNQRAVLEARTKAMATGAPRTITYRSCLTEEELKKGAKLFEPDKNCNETVLNSSGSRLEMKVQCTEEGINWDGTGWLDVLDRENVKGKMQVSAAGGQRVMKTNATLTSKWIGSNCGEVK